MTCGKSVKDTQAGKSMGYVKLYNMGKLTLTSDLAVKVAEL